MPDFDNSTSAPPTSPSIDRAAVGATAGESDALDDGLSASGHARSRTARTTDERLTNLAVRVLGPITVRSADGVDVTPVGMLQRRLLALLTLRRGAVVSADSAIDTLWHERSPRDAGAALQNHVSRLRQALPELTIESVGAGYRLDPTTVDVDIDRLEAVLARGHPGPESCAEIEALLVGWNGTAFPELEDSDIGLAERARLDDVRVRSREALAGAWLECGRVDDAIAELRRLVSDEPLRERPCELLMTALSASGRTAEAIRLYDEFRRRLGDELGIEPSAALAARHLELLSGQVSDDTFIATNLPARTSALVGREGFLRDLVDVTQRARLTTLTGPGGVGKTRLLVELGHRRQQLDRSDTIVWCALTQADADTAADSVADALGIDARPGKSPLRRIVDVVGDAHLVLLLDNCEHILQPVADLVDAATSACSNLTVIATSRERLRVPGEHVMNVPTLLDAGRTSAAVDLFVERARAVRPAFAPSQEESEMIHTVVRGLDGLPLAIELAAARLHTHELTEIVDGLDRPLELLSTGFRPSSRHGSLSAVVEWSYGQLDDDLRDLFDSVSIFVQPFAAADAAAVAGLTTSQAAQGLSQLVERSLVNRAPGRRFALLETLRAFGNDRLARTARSDEVEMRYGAHYVDWAVAASARLGTARDPVLHQIDDAVPELRNALGRLLGRGATDQASRMVGALINYAVLRLRPDVLGWADQIITACAATVSSEVWTASAYAAWMAGDIATAEDRAVRAVESTAFEPTGLTQVAATIRGNADLFAGRLTEAAEWYRRAIEAAGDDRAARWIAASAELLALGYACDERVIELADQLLGEVDGSESAPAAMVWYCAGESDLQFDVERARRRLGRAIELAERTNASFVRGLAGSTRASIEARVGDVDAAVADYRWLLSHWRRAGMWSTQWTMLRSIVGLLERLGNYREAAVLEGSIRGSHAGHRIFGADEIALDETSARLRMRLGDEEYEAALNEGATLDGDAAVEHAARSL